VASSDLDGWGRAMADFLHATTIDAPDGPLREALKA
jgi:hypothetical protein